MSNIYSFPDDVKDKIKGAYYSAKYKLENLFTGGEGSAEKGLSTTAPASGTGSSIQNKVPESVIKENPALPSIPTSGGSQDQANVQKQALDQVMNSGKYDMNDPAQKEQAFITAKQLSDEMMAGFSQFSAEARKNSGVDTLTSMRDEATANYFKMVNSIGSGQALAEINKKVDYTSDIDKTIEALKTKKATVAQDVFKRMQDSAGGTPVNYLEAERVINSQENLLDSQITNLQKVRDSRKQTVLDYAKNIEDDRTKQLENSKSMIEFYDKKVKEAQDAVKEGKADYKWLVDAQQKLQEAQKDYEFKARDMNIKEGELKLKFAETFGQVGDQSTSGTAEYIDKVGLTDGQKGGQCGNYTNKQLGVPGLFGDSFDQKKSVTNSTVPTPGSAFVMNTGTAYGHVGIVTKVLGNGQIEVKDSNFNNDETVRTHVISTKNIVGYYDPNKGNYQRQEKKDEMTKQIEDLKNKGASMDTIRSLLKSKYGKVYDGLIADTIAENYGTDSDFVKSQNFFDNLLNIGTQGRSKEEIYGEIKDMLIQNNTVIKELKLSTAGDQEIQNTLADVMLSRYVQTGNLKESLAGNAQVIAKIMNIFPLVSEERIRSSLSLMGIKDEEGWLDFYKADNQDDIFDKAREFMK